MGLLYHVQCIHIHAHRTHTTHMPHPHTYHITHTTPHIPHHTHTTHTPHTHHTHHTHTTHTPHTYHTTHTPQHIYHTTHTTQIFTSIPPFVLGLFDQDVTADGRLRKPSLYVPSQSGKGFNTKVHMLLLPLPYLTSLPPSPHCFTLPPSFLRYFGCGSEWLYSTLLLYSS